MSLDRERPYYRMVDGFRMPGAFNPEFFREAVAYNPIPEDLFIATYPKCGTTWMQQILYLLFNKGIPSENPLESTTTFLEMNGLDVLTKMKRPGAIKIHLPYNLTPYSPEAKYIYVARNPKDCCVSYYHHTKNLGVYNFQDGTFDEFFELFIQGEVDYMDYFDHLLGWYAHRDDPNVLFLTYEGMKADVKGVITQVAKFIAPQYEEMVKDQEILNRIIRYSSLGHMKKEINEGLEKVMAIPTDQMLNNPLVPEGLKHMLIDGMSNTQAASEDTPVEFIRKGEVGDWKNYFSEEQNKRMNERIAQKTKDSDVMDLWKDEM